MSMERNYIKFQIYLAWPLDSILTYSSEQEHKSQEND